MLISFKLFKSSEPDVMFDQGRLKVNIEDDIQLVKIDEILLGVIDKYLSESDILKKYGRAYLGKAIITDITITDEDKGIDLPEEEFREYAKSIMPKATILWDKHDN